MNQAIKVKLSQLPASPGVYFFYDKSGQIIYIGKASILKRRVASYFQKRTKRDYKTAIMVEVVDDLSFMTTESEISALFLEAELIKRYKPLYNVRERDDKNFIYVKVTSEPYPRILLVRRPSDDKAKYFGPFISSYDIKKSLRYLRRVFPYYDDSKIAQHSSLEHQIGVAPKPDISEEEYRGTINQLTMVFRGKTLQLQNQLERLMNKASDKQDYEAARHYRDQLLALKSMGQQIIFGARESVALSADQALSGLMSVLQLEKYPHRIEAYDISNFAGGDAVASMIVFIEGLPSAIEYRKFKMKTVGPNDFAMMAEVIRRRFSSRNSKWARPDLIIIDGGKGQLGAVLEVFDRLAIDIPTVGLAKRLEQIVICRAGNYSIIELPITHKVIALLQRIRDEAHRFAVSYHSNLRDKRVRTSVLDSIPGVGPETRKKLLRKFGSVAGIKVASEQELAELVGKKAKVIKENLR